jgi:probable addiction module antidote protein
MEKTRLGGIPKGFSAWDHTEILKTEENIRFYLEASIGEDEGDGKPIQNALDVAVRVRGMPRLARDKGLAREGLYKALSCERNPEFSTVMKVTRALGLKLAVTHCLPT